MARILIFDGAPAAAQANIATYGGRSNTELFTRAMALHARGIDAFTLNVADGERLPQGLGLADFDGVVITGSPLNVYKPEPAVTRQIELAREVFASGPRVNMRKAGGLCPLPHQSFRFTPYSMLVCIHATTDTQDLVTKNLTARAQGFSIEVHMPGGRRIIGNRRPRPMLEGCDADKGMTRREGRRGPNRGHGWVHQAHQFYYGGEPPAHAATFLDVRQYRRASYQVKEPGDSVSSQTSPVSRSSTASLPQSVSTTNRVAVGSFCDQDGSA